MYGFVWTNRLPPEIWGLYKFYIIMSSQKKPSRKYKSCCWETHSIQVARAPATAGFWSEIPQETSDLPKI